MFMGLMQRRHLNRDFFIGFQRTGIVLVKDFGISDLFRGVGVFAYCCVCLGSPKRQVVAVVGRGKPGPLFNA